LEVPRGGTGPRAARGGGKRGMWKKKGWFKTVLKVPAPPGGPFSQTPEIGRKKPPGSPAPRVSGGGGKKGRFVFLSEGGVGGIFLGRGMGGPPKRGGGQSGRGPQRGD